MSTAPVTGTHGRTGALVVDELLDAGLTVTVTVRCPEQVDALPGCGASAQLLDLTATTEDMARAMSGIDGVVCTAGRSHGARRNVVSQVDGDAISPAADAAVHVGADRFMFVSAHRSDEGFGGAS